jgi:hypothetical protein
MLKVEVPMIFLGTQGFSARREGRYILRASGIDGYDPLPCLPLIPDLT